MRSRIRLINYGLSLLLSETNNSKSCGRVCFHGQLSRFGNTRRPLYRAGVRVANTRVVYFAGGGAVGHVLATEFRGMALNGLLVLVLHVWSLNLVPLTDSTYKYHPGKHRRFLINKVSSKSFVVAGWVIGFTGCKSCTDLRQVLIGIRRGILVDIEYVKILLSFDLHRLTSNDDSPLTTDFRMTS